MPSAAAMARSSGVVMNPRTRSAFAPTYAVRTVTVALSSFGYWRTFSVRIACSPAMMITRLTTIASTGRRTKMSVNFMGCQASMVLGLRCQLRVRGNAVVDGHLGAVAQLEGACDDHLLPRLHAVLDGHEVTATAGAADELLARLLL